MALAVSPRTRGPGEEGHVDVGTIEADAFGFEEAALEGTVGFGDEQASAGADDAVPGDALSAGASGHGVADGARASRKAEGTRQCAVGGHFPARDFFDQAVDRLPGHGSRVLR